VLMLGPSGILETQGGTTGTMADMMCASLQARRPDIEWNCRPEAFYISDRMAARAVRIVEREKPRAVVLMIGSPAFADDFVVYRIRELWPPAFQASLWLSRTVKAIAGGGGEGSRSPRGTLFRLPRRLGIKLIGAAPIYRMEAALGYARECVEALLRLEDVA